MKYLAHTKEPASANVDEDNCHPLAAHLNSTARYAKERASAFNAEEPAEIIGLLHDVGKYSTEFQKRIRGKNIRAPHAMAGAFILNERYGGIGRYYGLVVASHHVGLYDYGTNENTDTYCGKLNCHNAKDLPYENEIALPANLKHKQLENRNKYHRTKCAGF